MLVVLLKVSLRAVMESTSCYTNEVSGRELLLQCYLTQLMNSHQMTLL